MNIANKPRKKVHTGRHDVDARVGVGFASSVRAIMPLPMTRFDFLPFWTDEALFPPHSRVAACFDEGWIGDCGQSVVVVGRVSGLSRVIYGTVSSPALRVLEGDVALVRLMMTVGWTN